MHEAGTVDVHPVASQPSALHRFRIHLDIAVVVVVLVLTDLIAHFTTPWASAGTVPAAAVGLVILMRCRGLGWADLGLGREHWKPGLGYALAAVAVVASVIAVGVLLPATRPMFLNNRYATISGAMVASMVIIRCRPSSRGAGVSGRPARRAQPGVGFSRGRAGGLAAVRAVARGHVVRTDQQQRGVHPAVRRRDRGNGGGVAGAVVATGAAGFVFSWLRRRSGSLIAPIALHWSLNGLGALAAAFVWHLST